MTSLSMDYQTSFELLNSYITPSAHVRTWIPLAPSSASISTSVDKALSFMSLHGAVIDDRLAVEDFLTNNYGVVAHLYSTPEKIAYYIGNAKIKVGVFSEPDGYDAPELYIEVETSLSPEEANTRLSTLNREWVIASNDDLNTLNVTLKFI